MTRGRRLGPVSPLLPAGLVLTAVGLTLYLMPGPGMPLLAGAAFVLAVVSAAWAAARDR